MPFTPSSNTIAGAGDVFLSGTTNGDLFKYNSSTSKWNNASIIGTAALANSGGQETAFTVAGASGTQNLDLANGNVFDVTMTGATTFTFSGATSGKACSFSLYLHQGSGTTVTWPSSVKWSGGAPSLSTTAGAVDILVFESLNGGITWYGSLVGTNFV